MPEELAESKTQERKKRRCHLFITAAVLLGIVFIFSSVCLGPLGGLVNVLYCVTGPFSLYGASVAGAGVTYPPWFPIAMAAVLGGVMALSVVFRDVQHFGCLIALAGHVALLVWVLFPFLLAVALAY